MILIIVFLFFQFSLMVSADPVYFDRTFGGPENDYAHSITQTTDGGYIIAGQTDSFGGGAALRSDWWIIKTDKNGWKEWEKTFGGDEKDGAMTIIQTSDGNYLAGGWTDLDMTVMKLDTDGDSIWMKTFKQKTVSSINDVQQTADGGFILTGRGTENVIKLDPDGNKEWGKQYGWIFNSIRQTADDGFLAVGDSIFKQLDWSYIPCITVKKLDRNGNLEWSYPFGEALPGTMHSIEPTPDFGFVIAGDSVDLKDEHSYTRFLVVSKINRYGIREWSYYGDEYTGAISLQPTADGGYITTGNTSDSGHGLDLLITKLDKNGNKVWSRTYGENVTYEYASAIRQTPDGGFIVAGHTESYGAGKYDMWILKLDANGDITGNAGISSTGINSSGFSFAQNFPNPFKGSTELRFHLPVSSDVILTVHDLSGRKIETLISRRMPAGDNNVHWPSKNMKSGLYLFHLKTENFRKTVKGILIK